MKNKLRLLLLLLLVYQIKTLMPNFNKSSSLCIIKNLDYNNEFLYAYHESKNNKERKIYTNPISLKYMKTFDQAEWLFVPIYNQTFYIRSSLYKQYMCASDINFDLMNKRRKVRMLNKVDELKNTSCMWKLEQLNKRSNQFMIWNVKYKEPLYAASAIYKTMDSRRNVYTWVKKSPNSKQFIWSIGCHHVTVTKI
jgi:hypothetical protein